MTSDVRQPVDLLALLHPSGDEDAYLLPDLVVRHLRLGHAAGKDPTRDAAVRLPQHPMFAAVPGP